jgi:radical SAM protein with 4Fe4S-binding SPASM domain
MACNETPWLSNREFVRQFEKKSGELRIPLKGSLDVTSRCNLNCVHCYLGPHPAGEGEKPGEMSTDRIRSVLDQITEAGCLNLLLTGGEPLLRKDFSDIYGHAKRNGMLVTVFSNGTMITDDVVSLLVDLPPQSLEISLYGATEATYEAITRVKGSYKKCWEGIHRLLAAHIPVELKTVLMTMNRDELFTMENMAKALGVAFRFDAAIFPRLNGDRSPVGLRVPPDEVVDKEFADEDRYHQWREFYHRTESFQAEDKLYTCGAGTNTFHIDACGTLKPCLMLTSLAYPLEKGDFLTGWRDVMSLIGMKKPGKGYTCSSCEKSPLCGYCPAFFALENGSEDSSSEYLCGIGSARFERIRETRP